MNEYSKYRILFVSLKCMPFLCQPLHSTLPSIRDNHLGCNFGGGHPLPFKLSCYDPSLSVLHSVWPMISFHNNCRPVFYTHTRANEISPPILHNKLVVKTMLL